MSGKGARGKNRGGQLSQSKLLLKRSAQEAGLDSDRQMVQAAVRPSLFPDLMWHSSGTGCWVENEVTPPPPTTTTTTATTNDDPAADTMVKQEDDSETAAAGEQPQQSPTIAKRPASVVALIQKQRQLWQAFGKSSHYVRPTQNIDVVRYGKPTLAASLPDQAVLLSMSAAHLLAADHDDDTKRRQNNNNNNKLATDERYFPAELLSTNQELRLAHQKRHVPKKTLTSILQQDVAGEIIEADNQAEPDNDNDNFLEELEDLEAEEVEDYTMNYYASDVESDGDAEGEATF